MAVDALLEFSFASRPARELVDFARAWEVQQRRSVAVTHALVSGLEAASAAPEFGYRDTSALLADLLRLAPGDARARCRASAELGPRRSLLGEKLAPQFEHIAAAQRAGAISAAHAKVIIGALDALTPEADVRNAARVQTELVEHALELGPKQLASAASRLLAYLDPDGREPIESEQQRRRSLVLSAASDGSGVLQARLNPELLAMLQTVLDPLSARVPAEDGAADSRTAGQRNHDGLLDLCHRALRDGVVPAGGGVTTTLILTISEADYRQRRGFATTPHGGLVSATHAARLSDQAEIYTAALNTTGGIVDYGRRRRVASQGQRLALYARDRGCSFPGCSTPPTWTQAHHVIEWQAEGPTAVGNLTLLCGRHHRNFEHWGWSVSMQDGLPWWTPPPHVDPERRPRRNRYWLVPERFS